MKPPPGNIVHPGRVHARQELGCPHRARGEHLPAGGVVAELDHLVPAREYHPSGTALMLADAAASALPYEPEYVYDRYSVRKPRDSREIGISSLRGGTIVGQERTGFAPYGNDDPPVIRVVAAKPGGE